MRLLVEPLESRRLLAIDFSFNIIDPGDDNSQYYDGINRILNAVGNDWGSRFTTTATLQINVEFEFNTVDNFLVRADIDWAEPVREIGDVQVFELGGPHEIRTGQDPNGGTQDATLTFNTSKIEKLFFDPAPQDRSAPIPDGEFDAYSVLLHEIGHIVGLQGIKDGFTGEPRGGNEITTYDEFVAFTGPDTVVWTGENATEAYGEIGGTGRVPLTLGNISNYGNLGGPGADLYTMLMGGAHSFGERLSIGNVELAMLFDMGLPVIFEGGEAPNPPVPPVLDIGGTRHSDVIEVIYTGSMYLLNVTNTIKVQDIDFFTGESIFVDRRQTMRYEFPSEGFTDVVIRGLGGNDRIVVNADMPSCTIFGDEGNDTIIGGDGDDTIFGNAGNDQLIGGNGDDRLDGGYGRDYLVGGFGDDRMFGDIKPPEPDPDADPVPERAPDTNPHDTLDGSAGDDWLWGGDGNDSLIGGAGDDHLLGEDGNDELFGADGRDRLDGGTGADLLDGGPGVDTADYLTATANLIVTLDERPGDGEAGEGDNVKFNVENIWGGSGNDRLVGTGANNVLFGGFGNDAIDGGTGNDFIEGSDGDDVLDGMIGDDTIYGGAGNDRINGGPDRDLINGGVGNDRIFTIDRSADTINGGPGEDLITTDELDIIEDAGL